MPGTISSLPNGTGRALSAVARLGMVVQSLVISVSPDAKARRDDRFPRVFGRHTQSGSAPVALFTWKASPRAGSCLEPGDISGTVRAMSPPSHAVPSKPGVDPSTHQLRLLLSQRVFLLVVSPTILTGEVPLLSAAAWVMLVFSLVRCGPLLSLSLFPTTHCAHRAGVR